jgi:hypothetical protein
MIVFGLLQIWRLHHFLLECMLWLVTKEDITRFGFGTKCCINLPGYINSYSVYILAVGGCVGHNKVLKLVLLMCWSKLTGLNFQSNGLERL